MKVISAQVGHFVCDTYQARPVTDTPLLSEDSLIIEIFTSLPDTGVRDPN